MAIDRIGKKPFLNGGLKLYGKAVCPVSLQKESWSRQKRIFACIKLFFTLSVNKEHACNSSNWKEKKQLQLLTVERILLQKKFLKIKKPLK